MSSTARAVLLDPPTEERDTTVHGPSGTPEAIGDRPDGPILTPEAIAQVETDVVPIRLNHLLNDRHDIRHPSGTWYSFNGHVLLIDEETQEETDAIASWIEDLIGRDIIKRDDLPTPIPCLLCEAQGKFFTTRCLPLYSRHMLIAHQ